MIVFPMAGKSSRFLSEGYTKPKYMLEAHGKTIFEYAVTSFKHYFDKVKFLFICRDVDDSDYFITSICQAINIENFEVVILQDDTKGQADTVRQGLLKADINIDQQITIFNIDTFRPNFQYPEFLERQETDGYLETFIGEGKNWSNILPSPQGENLVALTAEKQEISKFCCTGIYYFGSAALRRFSS